eukprot:Skav229277  [mRNA]  locus=scaffold952:315844:320262:- [translate_table: standard]
MFVAQLKTYRASKRRWVKSSLQSTFRMDTRQEQALLRRAVDSEARFQKVIEAKQRSLCEKQVQLQTQVAAAEEALRREKEAALELQTEVLDRVDTGEPGVAPPVAEGERSPKSGKENPPKEAAGPPIPLKEVKEEADYEAGGADPVQEVSAEKRTSPEATEGEPEKEAEKKEETSSKQSGKETVGAEQEREKSEKPEKEKTKKDKKEKRRKGKTTESAPEKDREKKRRKDRVEKEPSESPEKEREKKRIRREDSRESSRKASEREQRQKEKARTEESEETEECEREESKRKRTKSSQRDLSRGGKDRGQESEESTPRPSSSSKLKLAENPDLRKPREPDHSPPAHLRGRHDGYVYRDYSEHQGHRAPPGYWGRQQRSPQWRKSKGRVQRARWQDIIEGKAKAKAKAAPRVPPLHRPAARVLRRPGAHVEGEAAPEVGVLEKFRKGEEVDLHMLPLEGYKAGTRLVVTEGTYYDGPCQVAGRVREVSYHDSGTKVKVILTGTKSEELLKHGTGLKEKFAEFHICDPRCMGEPHAPGFVHAKKGYAAAPEKDVHLSWEKNLEAVDLDELGRLRELEQQAAPAVGEKEKPKKTKKTKSSSSSRSTKKKKKKEKKKKKDKKDEEKVVEKKKRDSPEKSSEGEVKEKKKKRTGRSYGGRTIARKKAIEVYGGTGMDPRGKIRRKVAKYAKKKSKKRKSSSSSSSTSTSEGSGSENTEEANDVLQDQNRIRQMHRHGPGLLFSTALQRMQGVITEVEGVWSQEESGLHPLCLRYVRSQLSSRLTGAAQKEAVTLGAALDLLVQSRVAEAGDYLIQRLKSLERISQGVSWQTSERLELAPGVVAQLSSSAEMQAAKRDAKMDQEAKGNAPAWGSGKGAQGKGSKKGKSEEKGKGKRKEAPKSGTGGAS